MSRVTSMFDLAIQLTRQHERDSNDAVSVVSVLVDDLEEALPILVALCRVSAGRLFNTAAGELDDPVPGTTDALRRAAISQALTAEPSSTRHVDLVDQPGDRVDAVFADPPAGVASPGEQAVLAVARAVVHRELDDHAFAIIAYRETLIDLPFRRAIWSLARDQLDGMRHTTLRTLVFVAEATVDIPLHCRTGRGFEFALDGPRLLRRRGSDALTASAAAIARHQRPLVLFLGAGFSASSHMPLGDATRDEAIRRLLDIPSTTITTSLNLAERFHRFVSEHSDWLSAVERGMTRAEYARGLTLEQVTRIESNVDATLPTLRAFKAHHDRVIGAPGAAVLDLAHVLESMDRRIVLVEVNFDELIESHATVPLKVFASPADFLGAPEYLRRYLAGDEAEVPLLKLHGTISRMDTCIVSAEQTELGVGQPKLEAVRALLDSEAPRLWIYVGASLRDLDLRPLLLGEEFGRGVDERWVSPYLADSLEAFGIVREPLWRGGPFPTVDDRLIAETADAFFAALHGAAAAHPAA